MGFSQIRIEQAGVSFEKLLNVHMHRKELENLWAKKGEVILERTTVNFPDINGYTLLDYAIILGDVEKIELLIAQGAKSKKADTLAKESENNLITTRFSFPSTSASLEKPGLSPLMHAINAGNIAYAKQIIDEGCDVNQTQEYASLTAMDYALLLGNVDMVMYLVEHGARLDVVDTVGANFISKAIRTGNVDIVKYALSQNLDYSVPDYFGKSPLHYAAECKNPEVIHLILNDDRFTPFKESIDIFDRDPLQIAINNDNEAFISQAKSPVIGQKKESVLIGQGYIIETLQYYLRLTNQNPYALYDISQEHQSVDDLSISGQCNGLEFLFLIFCAKGKKQDFFNILKAISKWNGTYESLGMPTSDIDTQHDSVEELFRYVTDHVIFLQQTNISQELTSINPTQKSRVEQYRIIGDEELSLEKHFSVNSWLSTPLDMRQLSEYISILNRLPNTMVEITSLTHATGLFVDDKRTLSYYDSNIPYELPPTHSVEPIVKLINSLQYKSFAFIDLYMPMIIMVYKSKNFSPDEYSFFQDDELPKNKDEARIYQSNSPNHFTHLHIAVLAESLHDLKQILANGMVDVDAKDINGDTPLTLAIKNNKPLMVFEILHFSDEKNILHLYTEAFNTQDEKIKALYLQAAAQILKSDKNLANELMMMLKEEGNSIVKYLIENHHEDLMRHLSHNTDVKYSNFDCEIIIRNCLRQENTEFLSPLIELAQHPSELSPYLLVDVIQAGNISLAKKIIEYGVNPDIEVEIPSQDPGDCWSLDVVTARSLAHTAGMHELIELFNKIDNKVTETSTRVPPVVIQYNHANSSSEPQTELQEINKDSKHKPK